MTVKTSGGAKHSDKDSPQHSEYRTDPQCECLDGSRMIRVYQLANVILQIKLTRVQQATVAEREVTSGGAILLLFKFQLSTRA